jgi:hypothetical protein
MKPPSYRHVHLLPLLLSAFAIVSCGYSDPNTRETTTEKTEWSILQIAETASKSRPIKEYELQIINGYEVLGIHGYQSKNIWILLNPSAPPFYKQIPDGNYYIPANVVVKLIHERQVGYTVESVLASHTNQE